MWQVIILIFIAIFGIIANGLILLSVIKYKVLRKKTYAFLLSLALCDTIKIAVIINIIIYTSLDRLGLSCARTSIFGITLSCVTTFHLAAESVNRCLIVIKPYNYIRMLKKKHIAIAICLLWMIPIAFCVATPLIWFRERWRDYLYFHANIFGCISEESSDFDINSEIYVIILHIVFFAIPLTLMLVCNGLVLKTSYTIAQKMREVEAVKTPKVTSPAIKKTTFSSPIIEMVSSSYSASVISEDLSIKDKIEHMGNRTMSIANASRELKRQLKMRKHEIKSSKTVLIMLSAFIICNAPIFTVGWFSPKDDEMMLMLVKAFLTLSQLQVFIDPMVYFLRLRDFKEARKRCKTISRTIIRKTIRRF